MSNTLSKWNVSFNVIENGVKIGQSDIDMAAYSEAHAMDAAAKAGAAICRGTAFVWVPTSATRTGSLV
jgi:hypothetical protein